MTIQTFQISKQIAVFVDNQVVSIICDQLQLFIY